MTVIGATEAAPARKLIQVFASEVIPGDQMRDRGMFRQVSDIEIAAEQSTVTLVFGPVPDCSSRLSVPSGQRVSVWRLCREP
jgi:hypothetical protein